MSTKGWGTKKDLANMIYGDSGAKSVAKLTQFLLHHFESVKSSAKSNKMRVIDNKTRFSPAFMKEAAAKFKRDVIPRVRSGSTTVKGKRVNTASIKPARQGAPGHGYSLVSVPDSHKTLIKRLKFKIVGPLNKGFTVILVPSSEIALAEQLGWTVLGGVGG